MEDKTYDAIIIDLNNIYCANYAIREKERYETVEEALSVGGIYGTVNSIKSILKKFGNSTTKVWVLADNPTSRFSNRKMISPDYKINRIERPRQYYRGLELVSLIVQSFSDNFNYLQVPNMEADDFVPVVIEQIPVDKEILMVSSDMDWARCIDYKGHKVSWYAFNHKRVISKHEFVEKHGFEPTERNIVTYKSFRGDSSDNIEIGVPHIPEKILLQLLDYGDVEDIIRDIECIDFVSDHWKEVISERSAKLRINYQLVSFYPVVYKDIASFHIKCKYQPTTLKILYEGLGVNIDSFDRRVSEYIAKNDPASASKKVDGFFIQPRIKRA